MINKVGYLFGYLFYNVFFWLFYFFEWVKVVVIRGFFHGICASFNYCPFSFNYLISKQLKDVIFQTYFPKKYKVKRRQQEIFTITSERFSSLHRYCFGNKGVDIKVDESLSNEGNEGRNYILIDFHSIATYRRLFTINQELNIKKLGIIAKNKNYIKKVIRRNYGIKLSKNQDSFRYNQILVKVFALNNPFEDYSRLVKYFNKGGSIFLPYILPNQKKLSNLFDSFGNVKEKEKFFVYSYKSKELLMVSNFLLYLLKRTGAKGIPVYTHRMSDGKDKVILGEEVSITKEESLSEKKQELFNKIFDFMSENILSSSKAWINVRNLSRVTKCLRRPEKRTEGRKWETQYNKQSFQLSSPVLVDKYGSNEFLITSTDPVQSVKTDIYTKRVVDELRSNGRLTEEFRSNFPRKKLKKVILNLWKSGIIEKKD